MTWLWSLRTKHFLCVSWKWSHGWGSILKVRVFLQPMLFQGCCGLRPCSIALWCFPGKLSWLALVSFEVWVWQRFISAALLQPGFLSRNVWSPILEQHYLSNWNYLPGHCLSYQFSYGIVRKKLAFRSFLVLSVTKNFGEGIDIILIKEQKYQK